MGALATLVLEVGEAPVPACNPEPARTLAPRRRWWMAAAAVAAVLIVGGVLWQAGTGSAPTRWDEDACVAYLYGQRVTDRNVGLGEMQKTMTAMTADGSDVVEEQLTALFGND